MDDGRRAGIRVAYRRDAESRSVLRHWFAADARALAVAFGTSVAVVLVASWLLEWPASV